MTAPRSVRALVDRAARASGLLSWAEAAMRRRVTILTYHRVLPEGLVARYPFPSLAIPVKAFEEEIGWLASSCTVLPLGEALDVARRGALPRSPLVAVTFDDGYADSFEAAAPILEARGVRGTFFATVGPIEEGTLLWFDRAALLWSSAGPEASWRALGEPAAGDLPAWVRRLGRMDGDGASAVLDSLERAAGRIPPEVASRFRVMTAAQARELARRGHELASHTLTHPFLTSLGGDRLRQEVGESRTALASLLGHEVQGFCYPAGDHDARTVQAVRDAGYRYACTTEEGPNVDGRDPFRLRRYDVTRHRVTRDGVAHDALGFRMEVSGLRHAIRRVIGRAA